MATGTRYSKEQREEILAFLEDHTYEETQTKFGVSQMTLARWVKRARRMEMRLDTNTLTISTEQKQDLELMVKMLQLLEGVESVVIINQSGDSIASALGPKEKINRIVTTAVALLAIGERTGESLGGFVKEVYVETSGRKILVVEAGKKAVLTIIFSVDANHQDIVTHNFYHIDRIRGLIASLL